MENGGKVVRYADRTVLNKSIALVLIISMVITTLLAGIGTAIATEGQQGFYTFNLESLDKDTGAAIGNAEFTISEDGGQQVKCGPGEYTFPNETGSYTITVDNKEGNGNDASLKVKFSKTDDGIAKVNMSTTNTTTSEVYFDNKTISFRAAANPGTQNNFYTYTLRSINKDTSSNISNAKFNILDVATNQTVTTTAGNYTFNNPRGTYVITVDNGESQPTNSGTVTLEFSADNSGNVKLNLKSSNTAEAEVNMKDKVITFLSSEANADNDFYTYTMESVYKEDGTAISGAKFNVKDLGTNTETVVNQGTYTFTNPMGTYEITVDNGSGNPENGGTATLTFTRDSQGNMRVQSDVDNSNLVSASTDDRNIKFTTDKTPQQDPFFTYTLKSLDKDDNTEIKDSTFTVSNGSANTNGIKPGEYNFGSSAGTYVVTVSNGSGYPANNSTATVKFSKAADGQDQVTVETTNPAGVKVDTKNRTITFLTSKNETPDDFFQYTLKSINQDTGKEISGAVFTIKDEATGTTKTSPAGTYTFDSKPATYTITVNNGTGNPSNGAKVTVKFEEDQGGDVSVSTSTTNALAAFADDNKKEITFKSSSQSTGTDSFKVKLSSVDAGTQTPIADSKIVVLNKTTGQRQELTQNGGVIEHEFGVGEYEITVSNPANYAENPAKVTLTVTKNGALLNGNASSEGGDNLNGVTSGNDSKSIVFHSSELSKMDEFYTFDFGSVDRKRSSNEIQGARFLIYKDGKQIATVTGDNPKYVFPQGEGAYSVKVENPSEYSQNNTEVLITFSKTGNNMNIDLLTVNGTDENDAVFENNDRKIVFRTTKVSESAADNSFTFDLKSVDAIDGTDIQGASFTVTKANGTSDIVKPNNGTGKYTFPQQSGTYEITVSNPNSYMKNETRLIVEFTKTGNNIEVKFKPYDQTTDNYVTLSQDKKTITFRTTKENDTNTEEKYEFKLMSTDMKDGSMIDGSKVTITKDNEAPKTVNLVNGQINYTFDKDGTYVITVENPSDYSKNRTKATVKITKDDQNGLHAEFGATGETEENDVEFDVIKGEIKFRTTKADEAEERDFYTFDFSSVKMEDGTTPIDGAKFIVTDAAGNTTEVTPVNGKATYEFPDENGSYTVKVVNPTGQGNYAENKSEVIIKFTTAGDEADVTIDGKNLTPKNDVIFGGGSHDIVFRTSPYEDKPEENLYNFQFRSIDKDDKTDIAGAKYIVTEDGQLPGASQEYPNGFDFEAGKVYTVTVDNGSDYMPNKTKVRVEVTTGENGDPKVRLISSDSDGAHFENNGRTIVFESEKKPSSSVAVDPPEYVGYTDGYYNNADSSKDVNNIKIERLYVTTFNDYVGANNKTERIASSEIAYCFNATRKFPKSLSDGKSRENVGPRENNVYISAYNKIANPSSDKFTDMVMNREPVSGGEWTPPRLMGEQLRNKIISIGLNGYPNDFSNLQRTLNVSDDDFRLATQYAIYYYTDPDYYDVKVNATLTIKQDPEHPDDRDHDYILVERFKYTRELNNGRTETDAEFKQRILYITGISMAGNFTAAQRSAIDALVDINNRYLLDADTINKAGTVFSLYEQRGILSPYTLNGKEYWYRDNEDFQHLLTVGKRKIELPINAPIKVEKTLDGQTPDTNEFWFQLIDSEGNVVETVNNDGRKVEFKDQYFSEPGTYTFFIAEKKGTDEDINYDTSTYMVKVVVTRNPDGTLSAETTYSRVGAGTSGDGIYYGFKDGIRLGEYDVSGTGSWMDINGIYIVESEVVQKYLENHDAYANRYLTEAEIQSLISESTIGYCFNATRSFPKELTENTDFFNLNITGLHTYTKISDASAETFKEMTDNENPSLSAEELRKAIISIGLNGYPNNYSGFQGNLSDVDFRLLTQLAVWYYTDQYTFTFEPGTRTEVVTAYNNLINQRISDKLLESNAFLDLFARDRIACEDYQDILSVGSALPDENPTFENKTKGEKPLKYTISAIKTLENGQLQDKQFQFKLTDITDPNNPKEIGKTKNDKNGKVTFDLSYVPSDKGKTFKYRLEEIIPAGDDGIKYDTTVYEVEVKISSSGAITATRRKISQAQQSVIDGNDYRPAITSNGTYYEKLVNVDGKVGYSMSLNQPWPGSADANTGKYVKIGNASDDDAQKYIGSDSADAIKKVIYNGYPNRNDKLGYYFDSEAFRGVTQAAIWYFTEGMSANATTADIDNLFAKVGSEFLRYHGYDNQSRESLYKCFADLTGWKYSTYTPNTSKLQEPPANMQIDLFVHPNNASGNNPANPQNFITLGNLDAPTTVTTPLEDAQQMEFKNSVEEQPEQPSITLYKVGADGEALTGEFKFTLYKNPEHTEVALNDAGIPYCDNEQVSNNEGSIRLDKLQFNTTYYLVETKCPTDYVLLRDHIVIRVDDKGNVTVSGNQTEAFRYVAKEGENRGELFVKNLKAIKVPEVGSTSAADVKRYGLVLLLAGMLLMIKTLRKERKDQG